MFYNPYLLSDNIAFYFGMNCNNKCIYCRDLMIDKHSEFSYDKLERFIKFIENGNIPNVKHFTLIGGEPLLYFEQAKILIERIHKFNPNISFTFFTNGLLLDEKNIFNYLYENIDFLALCLSHDGINHEITRGKNPFSSRKVLSLVREFSENNCLAITTVTTQYTINFTDNSYYFQDLIGDRFYWRYSMIFNTPELSSKISPKDFYRELKSFLKLWKYNSLAKSKLLEITYKFFTGNQSTNLYIDLDGNTLRDPLTTIYGNIYSENFFHDYNRAIATHNCFRNPNCSDCYISGHCYHNSENCDVYTKELFILTYKILNEIMYEEGFSNPVLFKSYLLNYHRV